jgi:hypothetical protein
MDSIRITTRRYTFEIVREAAAEYRPPVRSPQEAADIARRRPLLLPRHRGVGGVTAV